MKEFGVCLVLGIWSLVIASGCGQTQNNSGGGSTPTVTFYVSPSGNDSNEGTSLIKPWKTFQKAGNSARAGNTVYLMEGTYYEKVQVNVSGSAEGYITFQNYNNGLVTIDGTSVTGDQMLLLNNVHYIKIKGLHFTNDIRNDAAGIIITNGAQQIEVRNCQVSNIHFSSNPSEPATSSKNANPVLVKGDNATNSTHDIIIDSCEVYNCRTGYSEALSTVGNVSTFEITNNSVHDITNIGIDMQGNYGVCPNPSFDQSRNGTCSGNTIYNCSSPYANAAGIYVDGGKDIVIERNRVYQCQYGVEVGCEQKGSASNIIVRDNLFNNNTVTGIIFGGYDYPNSGKVSSCQFLNNTCYNNDTGRSGNGELTVSYAENCSVKNNMFYASNQNRLLTVAFNGATGTLFDYNLYYAAAGESSITVDYNGAIYDSFTAYKAGTSRDGNSIFGDPTFVSSTDFQLQSSSPAIGAGDPSFSPAEGETDFAGNPRVSSGRVDIGAYQNLTSQ